MTILAIDAGTTGVTALVVSTSGGIVAAGRRELARHVPGPGWVEHAPEELWQATLQATRAALEQVDASDLTGIGITNQRETVLLWDRETLGSPRRAIGSQDRRTADICARLRVEGHATRVEELTGLRLDPSFSGTKLVWLAEHEPHTWALVQSGRYAVGTVDSYLIARMTRGMEHVTDVSNASRTLLLDLAAGDWSDEVCGLFGVPRDALPELVPSWGEVAVTDPRTFLDLDLPIAGIAGDRQSALFGQTCFDAGDSSCTYGPDSSMLTNTGTTLLRPPAGPLSSTAAWRSPSGALTYALEGSIRTPAAAAQWPDPTSSHLARDALEPIAVEVRDALASMRQHGLALTSLRVDGGAATDDLLCQVQADQIGIPVVRFAPVETAALGAAYLAGLGTGVWSSTDELREARQLDRSFTPSTTPGARESAPESARGLGTAP